MQPRSFFRSRNRVTGQTIAFSAKKVPEDNAAKEDYLRGLAQEYVASARMMHQHQYQHPHICRQRRLTVP